MTTVLNAINSELCFFTAVFYHLICGCMCLSTGTCSCVYMEIRRQPQLVSSLSIMSSDGQSKVVKLAHQMLLLAKHHAGPLVLFFKDEFKR